MALRPTVNPLLELLSPITSPPLRIAFTAPVLRRIYLPPALLPAISPLLTLPSLLQDIWKSVLRAVPKKKTTHSKTRSRQMAGKALKDVTTLNTCAGCGRKKRMHLLCPYCMQDIKSHFKRELRKDREAKAAQEQKELTTLAEQESQQSRDRRVAKSRIGRSKKTWLESASASISPRRSREYRRAFGEDNSALSSGKEKEP